MEPHNDVLFFISVLFETLSVAEGIASVLMFERAWSTRGVIMTAENEIQVDRRIRG